MPVSAGMPAAVRRVDTRRDCIPQPSRGIAPSIMRLSAVHGAYLKDLLARGYSTATVKAYTGDFQSFRSYLPSDDTRGLTPEHIMGYPAWLAEQGLKPGTISRRVHSASAFCKWLTRRGDLTRNPFDVAPRPKEPKRLPRPMPPDSFALLMALPLTPRNRAILALLRYEGLRLSELCGLDLESVDLRAGVVRILGKGGKTRVIPLLPDARAPLEAWLAGRGDAPGPLFIGQRGERLGKTGVERLLTRLLTDAGLPHYTPHQLRHSFGTQAVRAGVSLKTLMNMMGHESLETTSLYVEVTAEDMRNAAALMEAFEKAQDYSATPSRVPETKTPS